MDTSFINKNKIKTRLCQMLTMQKLSNGKDSCCCFSLLLLRCLGTQGKARRQDIFLFFSFCHPGSRWACEVGDAHLSPPWSGPSCQWPFLDGWGNLQSAPRLEALSVPIPGPRGCCWAREPWRVWAWVQTARNMKWGPSPNTTTGHLLNYYYSVNSSF